jgi:hypothetical protein
MTLSMYLREKLRETQCNESMIIIRTQFHLKTNKSQSYYKVATRLLHKTNTIPPDLDYHIT